MDVEMLVERMKVLAEGRQFGALRELCKSPSVQAIGRVTLLVALGHFDSVPGDLEKVPRRDPGDIPLGETEIAPDIVGRLQVQAIETLDDLRRASDTRLLEIDGISAQRLYLLRAVQQKYFGDEAQQAANRERGRRFGFETKKKSGGGE